MFSVKNIKSIDNKKCDKLVKYSNGLMFQSSSWRSFLCKLLNAEDHSIGIYSEKDLVGFLPLLVKKGVIGTIANSLPYYGSNGSIFLSSHMSTEEQEASINLITTWLKTQISSETYSAICIVDHPLSPMESQICRHLLPEYLDERICQITTLPKTSKDLLPLLHHKTRRVIKKSLRTGYTYRQTTHEEGLNFLINTHADNMKVIGGQAKNRRFFELAINNLNNGLRHELWVAQHEKEMVAALLIFLFHDVVEYFTPVILAEHRRNQPLSGIIYTAMTEYIRRGYKRWNWGGTWTTQEGVYRFKKHWGASEFPYKYLIFCKNDYKNFIKRYPLHELQKQYQGFYLIPYDQLV